MIYFISECDDKAVHECARNVTVGLFKGVTENNNANFTCADWRPFIQKYV